MRLIRDPLFVFLLFGLALFVAQRTFQGAGERDRVIEVTPGVQNQILNQWQAQMGRPPTADEASGLLDQWLREEIFYREARTLGLDENDTIIRRRLAQKLTFLNEDLANAEEPSPAELERYHAEHLADYREPERFSFEHRYFSSDRREDAAADAAAALDSPDEAGDPFILQKAYAARSAREIGDLFGREFTDALAGLDATQPTLWQGPVRSAYGWHLVRLTERTPARDRPLEEVVDAVRRDFQHQRRVDANEQFYQTLKERYDIRFIEPGP
jgi:peptidyl-prolyl cis-trans isomerase C